MIYAHLFRRDGITHVVVSKAKTSPSRRTGRYSTECGVPLDESFQLLSTGGPGVTPVTCGTCLEFITSEVERLESDK